jgi:hypothetical protein
MKGYTLLVVFSSFLHILSCIFDATCLFTMCYGFYMEAKALLYSLTHRMVLGTKGTATKI